MNTCGCASYKRDLNQVRALEDLRQEEGEYKSLTVDFIENIMSLYSMPKAEKYFLFAQLGGEHL